MKTIVFGIREVDEDALRIGTEARAWHRILVRLLETATEQASHSEEEEVGGADVLDGVEGGGRGEDQRRETEGREHDVCDRPRRDAGDRGDAAAPAHLDAARHDV